MLSAVFSACVFCGCWGMPEWPDEGVAHADWVESALEWRLKRGVDDCGQDMLALDALSLEWIANSTEIKVDIETEDWTFLSKAPELTAPLIQVHAWMMMRGDSVPQRSVLKRMKRIARRTSSVRFRSIRGDFN